MKVIFDPETNTLTIILKQAPIVESNEEKEGIILDYDATGALVSVEILDASERVGLPYQIEYQVATPQAS